ncbi:hypothetical protein VNI00_007416 [Paramarasmius palmivorus]|uniref:SEC7 domain-containing protein n=1 Tax=Paramarasmius palmivorus TaxID=297713 RepID=A0AAW0D2C5_9AGAR
MFRHGPQHQKSNGALRPVGPRDIRQKQQLNHRISRTDLDFEAALQQEGTFVIKEGIDVNELGKGFDSPAPTPSRPQPATPTIVPPTPSQRLERHHTMQAGDLSDEETGGSSGVGGSGMHHNVNRRSMYRSPGSSSSPDLATLLRKSRERASRESGGSGGKERERDKHAMDRLRRVMSPSPPPFSPGDRTGVGIPPSPSPLPGGSRPKLQPNRMDSSGWVLAGSTSSASNSPGKPKSTVRSKASTFLGKMLGGNTVRERSKTDAGQQNPNFLDAFNEPPLPPVPPLPPGYQNQNNASQIGSPIADVFTSSTSSATTSPSTSKPLPPIMGQTAGITDRDDPEERSMIIVEKPPVTPARTPPLPASLTFGKRRSMSVSDTDLKKVMMMETGAFELGNGNVTIKGKEKGRDTEKDIESEGLNGVLKDLKGQMSDFEALPITRPSLDLKYPTSSPTTPRSPSPLGSRRASYKRSNTDSQVVSPTEEKEQVQQRSASTYSLGDGGKLAPPTLEVRTTSESPDSDPAPIVPPRTSSLHPSPIRSTSGPATMTINTSTSPSSPTAHRPGTSPVRTRSGHNSFNLPPPSSNRGLRSMHRSTASSSEPSLIPSAEEHSRFLNRASSGSQQDLAGSDRHELNLTRFPSSSHISTRGSTADESGDLEARGRELAAKCWNEEEDFLAKDKIAEWLGGIGRLNKIALQHYMDYFDFTGLRLDSAFRRLCSKLYLKGETQQVDRLLEEFSRRYWDCNPSGLFGSANIVHAVTYSILLLNTDLHVADLTNRMSRNQFIKNTLNTIQMQLQPSNFGTQTSHSEMYDDSSSVRDNSDGATTNGNSSTRDTIRSKRSDSITSWNSISRETFMSSPALSLATTQVTTPGGPLSNESTPSVVSAPQETKSLQASTCSITNSNNQVYGRAWEANLENLLKDMYNAVKAQQILLPLNAGRASSSSVNVARNRSLRGPPDRVTKLKRGSIRGIQSIMGQSGVSPYSSNSSIDGRVSPSPSFAASTHEVYGSSSSFLSPTLGFASNLSHTIIKEAQEDDDRSVHSSASTSTDISITDEELALLGPPWAKEGMLCRKQYWESTGKRAKDKNWLDVFVVIQKGELNMFTFGENGGGSSSIVGGGNWLSNANSVGTVHLAHSLAHALPSPGYNRQRPHCMVLTLSNGGVYFFQAGTEELVNEWVSTCNYWAARTSKEPLAGGVSNMEYGWNRVPEGSHARSQSDSESVRDTDAISVRSGRSSRSRFGWREGGPATVRGSPWADRIVINDWKPPMPPVVSSFFDEETQLEALRKHVKSMKKDLQRHNELREPMAALYQPRSSNAVKAQNNWEKKSQYLLTEIVKYDSYIESLQTAMALRLKKRGEKALERALNGGGSDESRDVRSRRKADEATIHENDESALPPTNSRMHKRETADGGDDEDD